VIRETALAGLNRRWRNWIVYGGVTIASTGTLLMLFLRTGAGLSWAAVALAIWLYQGAFVGRRLALNRRLGETAPLGKFGPGTNATLLRGWLLACLAGFLFAPRPSGLLAWAPAVIYILADVADFLDGYLARISGRATLLGAALDMEFDALGLLITVAIAVRYMALPVWYLPVGLARYAFMLGLWARRRAGKPIHPLPSSDSRRALAGLQMGALGIILVPALHPPVTTLGGVLLALPLLIGFTRDWLVVSGVVDVDSESYQRTRARIKLVLLHWLPVLLRAVVIASVVRLANVGIPASAQVNVGSSPLGLPLGAASVAALRLVELAAGAAVGLGFAPRISAVLLLAPLLLRAAGNGDSPALLAAVGASVVVLMVGGGAFSVWQPENQWSRRRGGEERTGE
jgi:CDP-diacylglycerol--glycerol-3-phosphate 3-phosphatidyltransferase